MLYTFCYTEHSTSATITFHDKVLKGHQLDSVIHHSNKFTLLKTHGHHKSSFITNFIHKVYNKHPSGWPLVYSYRLLYRPTARADHPHGSPVPPKGSRPPASGWSRPQASTAHLLQWTPPTTPSLTYLIQAGWGELTSHRDLCRRSLSTTDRAGRHEGYLPPADQPPWDIPFPAGTSRPGGSGHIPC